MVGSSESFPVDEVRKQAHTPLSSTATVSHYQSRVPFPLERPSGQSSSIIHSGQLTGEGLVVMATAERPYLLFQGSKT